MYVLSIGKITAFLKAIRKVKRFGLEPKLRTYIFVWNELSKPTWKVWAM